MAAADRCARLKDRAKIGVSSMNQPRTSDECACLLLYYKQPSGAGAQFVCFPHGGVSAFEPLPRTAEVLGGDDCRRQGGEPAPRPAPLLGAAQRYFDLPDGSLQVDRRFHACLQTDARPVDVYLAQFTVADPPFEAVDRKGARFLELTEARDLSRTERELLERAYSVIMN